MARDFLVALDTGWRAVPEQCDLLVVGEMGIANTTVAATLCAALMGGRGARWAGRGTGVDDAGLLRKRTTIDTALKMHRNLLDDPPRRRRGARRARTRGDLRRRAGGARKIDPGAARRLRRDLGGAAAGTACAQRPRTLPRRARVGRTRPSRMLRDLALAPLLDLEMRLGEASGAGVAILLLRAALACHGGMATFAEAGVSGAD